ncbi:hypothetical protein [Pseudoxanthomonas sp. JBR18]|uniref:hypothetical protein n=1 Tax=Pseudoxanthomonas sp. JBR18 TaxID=2969308 RepID=UPI002305F465|nr:hypothetical protein [Pseudoxanthomonas sp. JBR18]WCE04435.1 hypothetical protein PJ250_00025 [Pseudoxanthomonas sp. JBR18]
MEIQRVKIGDADMYAVTDPGNPGPPVIVDAALADLAGDRDAFLAGEFNRVRSA